MTAKKRGPIVAAEFAESLIESGREEERAKRWVVITAEYGTNRIVNVFGPFDEATAAAALRALPASSMRDHEMFKLSDLPKPKGGR